MMRTGPVRPKVPTWQPGFCTSTGGADSVAAATADLRTVADLLDRSGDVASRTMLALGGAAADLPITGAVASPGSAADIACQVGALTFGPSGLGMLVLKTEALARLLRLAATVYDDAEATVRLSFAAIDQAVSPVRLVYETGGVAINAVARVFGADGNLVPGTDGFTKDVVTQLRMHLFGSGMPGVGLDGQVAVLTAGAIGLGWFDDSKPLVVNEIPPATPSGAGPADLGDLADDVASSYDESKDHENVLVRRVTQPDGSSAWVVSIPGTAQWSPTSTADPADLGANLRTMAGMSSSLYPAVTSCLTAAMRQAGVAPGKEPVMLVGHSQGGIVATRMAQDEQFAKKFNVKEVVTFASPVTKMNLPDSISGLDISNEGDVVPKVDQQDDANAANRSQITCTEPGDPDVSIDQHDIGRYVERADRFLGADTQVPAAQDFYRRAGATFLGGQSTTYEFTLSRPIDPPRPVAPHQ